MLFSEFQMATGCKDNEKNHKVYRDLEVMYMNSDMTKDEIYEYGKKLVDNSKSAEEIRFEKEIKKEIEDYKSRLKNLNEENQYWSHCLRYERDKEWVKEYRRRIKYLSDEAKSCRRRITELRWVLGK